MTVEESKDTATKPEKKEQAKPVAQEPADAAKAAKNKKKKER